MLPIHYSIKNRAVWTWATQVLVVLFTISSIRRTTCLVTLLSHGTGSPRPAPMTFHLVVAGSTDDPSRNGKMPSWADSRFRGICLPRAEQDLRRSGSATTAALCFQATSPVASSMPSAISVVHPSGRRLPAIHMLHSQEIRSSIQARLDYRRRARTFLTTQRWRNEIHWLAQAPGASIWVSRNSFH